MVLNTFPFQAEVNFEGLMQHVRDLQAPKPLTDAERELQAIKLNEVTDLILSEFYSFDYIDIYTM